MKTFTYGIDQNCYFLIGEYSNGRMGIEIRNNVDGAIAKITVNIPEIELEEEQIVIYEHGDKEENHELLEKLGLIKIDKIKLYEYVYE